MKIYLDVCCLNRPFDDQAQPRIRLEAEAVKIILARFDSGEWIQLASEMAVIEIDAITNPTRRSRVHLLMPRDEFISRLSNLTFERAAERPALGFKPADAVHLAAAEELPVDVFLSCDDRLLKQVRRHSGRLRIAVANPVEWLEERTRDADT